jgi:DNA-binding LacI/PurR family transcriptional regulator
VSYVLSGTRPISKPTRERIERAMRELDYTPNALARGLKSKRSKIIAVLFPAGPGGLPLSAMEYILGASDYAQSRGYHLLLWTTDVDALAELSQLAGQGLVDGVLLMEVQLDDPRVKVLDDARLTFVMIGRTLDSEGVDYADTDFDQCASVAVRHLAGLGHRRLGFVTLGHDATAAGRGNVVRLGEAVRRAAEDAGVTVAQVPCEPSLDAGRQAFHELLALDRDLTAVISFNERALPGIVAAAAEEGRRIPDELALVSIDIPLQAAEMYVPPMTTVSPPAARMGSAAVETLIARLEGDAGPAKQVLFAGRLEERGTTGPVMPRQTVDNDVVRVTPSR